MFLFEVEHWPLGRQQVVSRLANSVRTFGNKFAQIKIQIEIREYNYGTFEKLDLRSIFQSLVRLTKTS